MLYLDSSALVKLYIDEPGSQRVRQLVNPPALSATSAIAYAEIRAALARRAREGFLSADAHIRAKSALLADWSHLFVIPVGLIQMNAGEAADRDALRGMDAIHLASAMWLASQQREPLTMVVWDHRLRQAAITTGLRVTGDGVDTTATPP